MKIVIIGGTRPNRLEDVALLRQRRHEVVAASPQSGINSITGEGLKEAMAGAQGVIDLANSPSRSRDRLPLSARHSRGRQRTPLFGLSSGG
jgi:hypothetical protein